MNILVIGGSRCVGRAIADLGVRTGHTISVMNRGTRLVDGTRQLRADRNVLSECVDALRGKHFDVAIDCSCYTPDQARLLRGALQGIVQRMIWISTAAVYRTTGPHPVLESAPLAPPSPFGVYGDSKALAEREIAACGIPTVILRLCYVYGQSATSNREYEVWRQLRTGRAPQLATDSTPLQFVHALDVARATYLLLSTIEKGCRVYNIAGSTITMDQYYRTMRRVCEMDIPTSSSIHSTSPFVGPYPPIPLAIDSTKARNEVSWEPLCHLESALTDLYQHARNDL